jgi:hypothetical protein
MTGVVVFLSRRGWGRLRLENGEDMFFAGAFVDRGSQAFDAFQLGDVVEVLSPRSLRWLRAASGRECGHIYYITHRHRWGRILLDNGQRVFFGASAVTDESRRPFDDLRLGDRVEVAAVTASGPGQAPAAAGVTWAADGNDIQEAA